VFEARYDGRCPSCRRAIEKGEDVAYDADARVVHAECVDLTKPAKPAEVCPRCFMTKASNGACGCEEDR
jgi:hypothetical protein